MGLFLISLLGWAGHLTLSYFLIRPLPSSILRTLLGTSLCLILTALTCHDLPQFFATSMFTVATCWMVSMRLLQLTIAPFDRRLTFRSFLAKIYWTLLPIIRCDEETNVLWIVVRDLFSVVVKAFLCHWSYRWLLQCEPSASAERMCLFYIFIMSISFRLISKDWSFV